MVYSKSFVRLNWWTLIFIFLVTCAGSFVRITGSGMGCPDWPKCFGQIIPPTSVEQIPTNYKEIYSEKRVKKVQKFSKILKVFGFQSEATKILEDESLLVEQDFNARKTWTEYGNRLCGVLAGFGVLFVFIGAWFKLKSPKLKWLTLINLIILVIQAWFGSVVVATNLVPWTITLHMFLAIVIIFIQLFIVVEVSPNQQAKLPVSRLIKWLVFICLVITFVQMFLGTQVREHVDMLTQQGYGRAAWTQLLGMEFYIHRAFSWLVMVLMIFLVVLNHQGPKYKIIYSAFIVLVVELTSGVLLAYADMPGLVQTAHLIFAAVILSILFVGFLRMKVK